MRNCKSFSTLLLQLKNFILTFQSPTHQTSSAARHMSKASDNYTKRQHTLLRPSKISLNTKLKVERVLERLSSVTESWHKENNKKQLFEGVVNQTDFNFKPVFDLSPRDQLRPEINGVIKSQNNETIIDINFNPPKIFTRILITGYILCLVLSLILLLLPKTIDLPIKHFWWLPLLFIPLNQIIFSSYWKYKIKISTNKLKSLLK